MGPAHHRLTSEVRPGENAEVVVPGGQDPAAPGDHEKYSHERIAHRSSAAVELRPASRGGERESRKDEKNEADADSYGGYDMS